MKIGLLGGSFNPPHFGHLGISKDALKLLDLDEIWWLPTKQNPLKDTQNINFDERLKLCEEITQNEARILVKNWEKEIKSTYFIDLLEFILEKKIIPDLSTQELQSQCTTPDSRETQEETAKVTRSPSYRSEIIKNKKDAFCVNRQQKTTSNLNVATVLETKGSIQRMEPAIGKNSTTQLYLLIGADNLQNFHLWHKWQDIIKLLQIAVFKRENLEKEAKNTKIYDFCKKLSQKNQKEHLIFLENSKYDISSTKLRNNKNKNE